MLDGLQLARFRFTLRAEDPLRLPPYAGATLRGGFGHAFRRVGCIGRHGECPPCLVEGNCPYSYVFETPPPPDSKILRKYPFAPHPFVIEPPLAGKTDYQPGEELEFGLVLIGRAMDYLPYFIYAFDELGRLGLGRGRGRYVLEAVAGLSANGREGTTIYQDRILSDSFPILAAHDLADGAGPLEESTPLTLHFLTPLRLKFRGQLASQLEFHILIRNLLRRLSLLGYFHCGVELELDFRGLIRRAERVQLVEHDVKWHDWERYSGRQQERLKMGGLVGHATFEGELSEFVHFLRLGEVLHVGKGTVFGLGQYRIG